MKKLAMIRRNQEGHWVGDGFPVRTIFAYNDLPEQLSPFLLLDYAGPKHFPPSTHRRGVGGHPHRGFETVTIVYEGEVEHRDSSGGGGVIGKGDVQWMTAASGLVHEEFHGPNFSQQGGIFEVIQLWVNLPRKDKGAAPGYQSLSSHQIPTVELPAGAGTARVIAGEYGGTRGPARTFTPLRVVDLKLRAGHKVELSSPPGETAALFVLKGQVQLASGESVRDAELAVFERDGDTIALELLHDTTVLWLGGQPLHEPVVGYGPFVMSSPEEIRQAFIDYQAGRLGSIIAK